MARAQVTQEVMSIYGFALIGLILAIIAIVYFDVGKSDFLKRVDTCDFNSQIGCEGFVYNASSANFTILLRNYMDFGIYNVTLQLHSPCQDNVSMRMGEGAILGLSALSAGSYDAPCMLRKGTHEIPMTLNFTTLQDLSINRQKQGTLRVKII